MAIATARADHPILEGKQRADMNPATRNVATKRPACEEALQQCKKRRKGMRGWLVTALSPSAGLLLPAAPLKGQDPPRNTARKRTAEASPQRPGKLLKTSQQRVSVAHHATHERKTKPAGFKVSIAQGHLAVKRSASSSPEPRLFKKAKNRGEERNPHVKQLLKRKHAKLKKGRQSSIAARKAPRPQKATSAMNKPNQCASVKNKAQHNAPEGPPLQGSDSAEESARRYLAHLGVRLLQEQTVKKMISFASQGLGAGTYGSCCKGVDPRTGKQVVVKTFLKDTLRSLVTEASCLQKLQGHGMQRLVGVCLETRQLVTDFAGQTAAEFFHSGASFTDALSVILQVAQAVESVNKAGYTHNDIKSNNVCVQQSTGGPKATLIDLGLAKRVGTRGFYKTNRDINEQQRKFPWIAPELLRDSHPCSAASDVFSVAWFILGVPGWRDRPVWSIGMWDFKEWVWRARQPLPEQRPSFYALIQAVKQLQAEMSSFTSVLPCR